MKFISQLVHFANCHNSNIKTVQICVKSHLKFFSDTHSLLPALTESSEEHEAEPVVTKPCTLCA